MEENLNILNLKQNSNVYERVVENDTDSEARNILKNGILVETNEGLVCMSLNDALNQGVGGITLSEQDFHNVAANLLLKQEPSSSKTITTNTVECYPNITQIKNAKILKTTKTSFNKVPILRHINKKIAIKPTEDIPKTIIVPTSKCSLFKLVTGTENNTEVAVRNKEYVTNLNTTAKNNNPPSTSNKSGLQVVAPPKKYVYKDNVKPVMFIAQQNSNKGKKIETKTIVQENVTGHKGKSDVNVLSDNSELFVNNLTIKMIKYQKEETQEDIETSDNSETTFNITRDQVDSKHTTSQKKRGGWPKGRKRKPEVKTETRPPKAPATGYVLFLNEKRKEYKDMPFTEVTKLLGNEWSKLSLHEKKIYLDQAEVEKKRYREELKLYRQSDAYQTYLHKKRLKRLQGNGTEESDMDATDEIDDEDNEELYCRLCDQWFHSHHNKKEHLYGRQHIQAIAGRCGREQTSDHDSGHCNMSSTSLDESSLDGSSFSGKCGKKNGCCSDSDSLMIDDSIVKLMAINKEREDERKLLKTKLDEVKRKFKYFSEEHRKLKEMETELANASEREISIQNVLEQNLLNLFYVPTMFCLPDPSGDGVESTGFQISMPDV